MEKRYGLTFIDRTTNERGFIDLDTAEEARAWLAGMLTTPAPARKVPGPALASGAPPEPAPGTVGARVLASVRRKPGTLAEVKARLAGVAASSVRGRLSELVAAGLLTRKNDRFHAVTPSDDAVKSSPVRAAPSPPPARKGKS